LTSTSKKVVYFKGAGNGVLLCAVLFNFRCAAFLFYQTHQRNHLSGNSIPPVPVIYEGEIEKYWKLYIVPG